MVVQLPVTVALAEAITAPPPGEGWATEPKYDGHRTIVARLISGEVVVQAGRSGRTVTASYPELAAAGALLPRGVVLDGEAMVATPAGVADFGAMQRRALASPRRAAALARELPVVLAAFDVIGDAGGEDLRAWPYERRRARLLELLAPLAGSALLPVPSTTDADTARAWLDTGTVEGLVYKRENGAYRGGRRDWKKLRVWVPGDAVAVGYTGRARAPERLVLEVDGGRLRVSAPLPMPLRRDLGAALDALGLGLAGGEPARLPDGARYRRLPGPGRLAVEVDYGTTRHAGVAVRRLRPDLPV